MSGRSVAGLVLALLLAAGFAALGAWQLGRARWKAAYLDAHATALAAAPIGFATARDRPAGTPVRVVGPGRYDDTVTVLLDNRVRDGRIGMDVFTLFRPDDGATQLLVDRGWVALPGDRAVPPIEPAGNARTVVAGVRLPPPSSGLRVGELAFARDAPPPLWPRLDLERLAQTIGEPLAPAIVRLDDTAPHGFERAWQPLANTLPPQRHRGYAVQWFALAATVLVVASVLAFRRKR